jgi:putative transcriptional regulator
MDAEMFNELLESVRQGKDILKGERSASRRFYVNEINVPQLRSRFELTQNKFAKLLGISVSTLRNWEQGRRKPQGAARVLLQIADLHPEAVLDTTNT